MRTSKVKGQTLLLQPQHRESLPWLRRSQEEHIYQQMEDIIMRYKWVAWHRPGIYQAACMHWNPVQNSPHCLAGVRGITDAPGCNTVSWGRTARDNAPRCRALSWHLVPAEVMCLELMGPWRQTLQLTSSFGFPWWVTASGWWCFFVILIWHTRSLRPNSLLYLSFARFIILNHFFLDSLHCSIPSICCDYLQLLERSLPWTVLQIRE